MKKVVLFLTGIFAFGAININTATMKELHILSGIGHKKALAIIKYREKHKFEKIEDIMKVKGIGKKLFEKIKDEIEVK